MPVDPHPPRHHQDSDRAGSSGRLPTSAMQLPVPLPLLLALLPTSTHAASKPKNAILLSQVQSLTLRSGAMTSHRRVSAAPQLKCVSSPAVCRLHAIETMRCVNQGSGYSSEDIQWSCSASLPPELKLGSTEVVCEGFAGPDDEYVLKGSCGVEYRLILTDIGEEKYPKLVRGQGGRNSADAEWDWSGVLFLTLFVGVLAWMAYSAYYNVNEPRQPRLRRPHGGGGGGGGGWGPGFGGGGSFGRGFDDDDPPPPYSSKPRASSSHQGGGWRPGFWTGAATGAAAGYMAGNRGTSRQQRDYYGSGWAGPSSAAGSSTTSTERQESTGFGGTSRR